MSFRPTGPTIEHSSPPATITPEDIKFLCGEHSVQPQTVKTLLAEGITEEDLGEVLEHRNSLCAYDHQSNIAGQISAKLIAGVYNAAKRKYGNSGVFM